jgi:hypothetical protein
MKSVGEVMAIGGTFNEAFQKALRGLEVGATGFGAPHHLRLVGDENLARPTPNRIFAAAAALRDGMGVEELAAATGYDPWFVEQMAEIIAIERELACHTLASLPRELLREAKENGFSDTQIAALLRLTEDGRPKTEDGSAGSIHGPPSTVHRLTEAAHGPRSTVPQRWTSAPAVSNSASSPPTAGSTPAPPSSRPTRRICTAPTPARTSPR